MPCLTLLKQSATRGIHRLTRVGHLKALTILAQSSWLTMSDDLQELMGKRTITLAMKMALDFDTQYPREDRRYSELVLTMVPAAALIVTRVGI